MLLKWHIFDIFHNLIFVQAHMILEASSTLVIGNKGVRDVSVPKLCGTCLLTICLFTHLLPQDVWWTGYIKGFTDWRVIRQRSSYDSGRSGYRIPVEARFSVPVQNMPWIPPIFLYNGHLVSFPWVKRPGRCVDHPPSAEVKERVELYRYFRRGLHGLLLHELYFYVFVTYHAGTEGGGAGG